MAIIVKAVLDPVSILDGFGESLPIPTNPVETSDIQLQGFVRIHNIFVKFTDYCKDAWGFVIFCEIY